MGSKNSFGNLFRITTWGESHGKAMGVVIDGCPSNIALSEEMIFEELKKRRPGHSLYVSQRKEEDQPKILSGVFQGKTTGAPIHIMIENQDHESQHYEQIKEIYRPSHGNYTYHQKYGNYDYRGGGRFSGRETLSWVAAGAVAKALLKPFHMEMTAYLQKVGDIETPLFDTDPLTLRKKIFQDSIFCPDQKISVQMQELLFEVIEHKDSIGGCVGFVISATANLGEPLFEKLEANLAKAMLSIPGSKGFEIGEGFFLSSQRGSVVNDAFEKKQDKIIMSSNHSGGVLAGISTGAPLFGRVAFKPTPTIKLPQETVNFSGDKITLTIQKEARHDPCIAIRAVPVVEAMAALVMADLLLMQSVARIDN